MKKRMETVEVSTSEGSVLITQPNYGNDDVIISIPAEQIDALIKWLQEAKHELLGDKDNPK